MQVGTTFSSKVEAATRILTNSVNSGKALRRETSEKHRLRFICASEDCPFSLWVRSDVAGWKITSVVEHGPCMPSNKLIKASIRSEEIAVLIMGKVYEDPSIGYKALKSSLEDMLAIELGRKKIFRAKKAALRQIFGDHESSFELLEPYLSIYARRNPGTVFHVLKEDGVFKACFFAPVQAIEASKKCLPLFYLDGTHGKSALKGVFLVATFQDAERGIFVGGLGFFEGERRETWEYFLRHLAIAYPHLNTDTSVLISDRDKGLDVSIGIYFPNARHGVCIRHLTQNVKRIFGAGAAKFVHPIANAVKQNQIDLHLQQLQALNPQAAQYFVDSNMALWTKVHFPVARFDSLTSNPAESSNNALCFIRGLPITAAFDRYLYNLATTFLSRQRELCLERGEFTAITLRRHSARASQATRMKVYLFSNTQTRVFAGGEEFLVDLEAQTCTCRWFQDRKTPCWHAIASIRKVYGEQASFNSYVSDLYKVTNLLSIYSQPFRPAMISVAVSDGTRPPLINRQRGRPAVARRRGIQDAVVRTKKCSLCKEIGHFRPKCPRLQAPGQRPQEPGTPAQPLQAPQGHFLFQQGPQAPVHFQPRPQAQAQHLQAPVTPAQLQQGPPQTRLHL